MRVDIHPVKLGITSCYLLRSEGTILIDAGSPKQAGRFMQALERLSVNPREIQLIVLTHGHFDHIGSAKEIRDATGSRIALHHLEKDCLEKSVKPLSPGVTTWGKVFIRTTGALMPLIDFPATDIDILLGDDGLPLDEYGIPGRILPTPGHTRGSVSVLLETGDAFVGDLAMSGFPLRLSPGLPVLAEDMDSVKESWNLLISADADTIYPAHGKPFPIDVIRKALG